MSRLQVPSLIKLCVVAGFNNSGGKIKVCDILISCSVTQKYTSEVIMIKLSLTLATPTYADLGAKNLHAQEIRLCAIVTFKRRLICLGMNCWKKRYQLSSKSS